VKDSDANYGLRIVANKTNKDSGNNRHWTFMDIRPGDPITWTGKSSSDWSDPDNWSPERAPIDTDFVTIMPSAHDPQLSGSVNLNQLVISSGATMDLAGNSLTVTNGLVVIGSLLASDSTVFLRSGGQQGVRFGGSRFHRIEVSGGVKFQDAVSADEFEAETSGSGYTLTFADGCVHSFGTFIVNGVIGKAPGIKLVSTTPSSSWGLKVTAKGFVSGVSVSDSDASQGIAIIAETPSADDGNNLNWLFGVKGNHWTGRGDGKSWTDIRNWSLSEVPDEASSVYFDSAATVTLPAGETVSVGVLNVDSSGGLVILNAGDAETRLVVESVFDVGATGSLELNVPTTVKGTAYVRSGGKLSHSMMGDTRNTVKAWNRIDMAVSGDMIVEAGGAIDTVRKGYNMNLGSYERARVHGGRLDPTNTGWPAYGSVFRPVHGGESYDNWSKCAGGGMIRLVIGGKLTVDGTVSSEGYYVKGGSGTAGGSIWIDMKELAGSGLITAAGGKYDYAGGSAAAGGRVALYVATEAGTNGFTGSVTAKGGSYGTAGSLPSRPCGTIYWRFADDLSSAGTIIIDNALCAANVQYTDETGKKSSRRYAYGGTDLPAGEDGDAPELFFGVKVIVRRHGRLYLTSDLVLRDLVVEDSSDVFLNGYNLDIFSPAHKDRRGWSSDAYVLRPSRSDATVLGNLRWRKSGISVIFR